MLIGHSMPLSPEGKAPAFYAPPKHFGGRVLAVVFQADRDALSALIPEPLQLPEDPVCVVRMNELLNDQGLGDEFVGRYPEMAQYNEAVIAIPVLYEGELGYYDPYLWVDNHACAAGGRELYGLPKKMGKIYLSRHYPRSPIGPGSLITGTLEAQSHRLITARARLTREATPSELPRVTCFYTLRVIPTAANGGQAIWEVYRFRLQNYVVYAMYGGDAELEFGSSPFDELDVLQPTKITNAFYYVVDWDLPAAEVIYRREQDQMPETM
jgi:acetoacetate decarboxylase